MRNLLFVLLLLIFAGGLVYLSFDKLKEQFNFGPSGSELYSSNCAGCHGQNLEKFVNGDWKHGNSWNQVNRSIRYGYSNSGMPAFDSAFTVQELEAITDYVLERVEEVSAEALEKGPPLDGVIQSRDQAFRIETVVAEGLDVPWGLAFLPNGEFLITDRVGHLYRYREGGALQEIIGIPEVKAEEQGGLLDVAIHPNFRENQLVYLSFSKPDPNHSRRATTAVVRGRLEQNELKEIEEIFLALPYLPTQHHYGSRLQFDSAGYLFISIGDRGRRKQNPQSLSNHCGKIHRVFDDGSIPPDNPFVNVPEAVPSIYSYGHRNPQGLALNPYTGELWEHEHGPRGGDELNRIEKGVNYGWPTVSYGINYDGSKFTDQTEQKVWNNPCSTGYLLLHLPA